jgi:hypothetical protein
MVFVHRDDRGDDRKWKPVHTIGMHPKIVLEVIVCDERNKRPHARIGNDELATIPISYVSKERAWIRRTIKEDFGREFTRKRILFRAASPSSRHFEVGRGLYVRFQHTALSLYCTAVSCHGDAQSALCLSRHGNEESCESIFAAKFPVKDAATSPCAKRKERNQQGFAS